MTEHRGLICSADRLMVVLYTTVLWLITDNSLKGLQFPWACFNSNNKYTLQVIVAKQCCATCHRAQDKDYGSFDQFEFIESLTFAPGTSFHEVVISLLFWAWSSQAISPSGGWSFSENQWDSFTTDIHQSIFSHLFLFPVHVYEAETSVLQGLQQQLYLSPCSEVKTVN